MSVSYSYSRPHRVSASLRRRISEAAQSLGYAGPHTGAQRVRRSCSCVVTAVTAVGENGMFSDYESAQVLAGVAEVVAMYSGSVTCAPVSSQRSHFAEHILYWPDSAGCELSLNGSSNARVGVTLWPKSLAVSGTPNVWFDDYVAASELLNTMPDSAQRPLLIGAGAARKQGDKAGPCTAHQPPSVFADRMSALKAALEVKRGMPSEDVPVLWGADAFSDIADAAVGEMLTKYRPDLVMAVDDELALAVSLFFDRREQFPVSITGWGGSKAATRAGVTTFKPDWAELGSIGTRVLLNGKESDVPTGYVLSHAENGTRRS